jgi:site-specific DNA-methyltransferase (adenine-specific)
MAKFSEAKRMDKRIGNQKIILGDAISEMKKLPKNSVDLIVTDPPYNLGKDYGNSSDNLEFDEYIAWTKSWLAEADRILKDNGTIYVFMGVRYISYIYNILEHDMGYKFNSWITWYYTQGIGKTKGFSPRHDDILMFTKTNKFNFYLDNIRIPQKYYRSVNNMRGANPSNVWEFSHVHYSQKSRENHPTQKPEGLYERMILASSKENDCVLDPFVGSGTALRVCQQLNRQGIGIEKNESFVGLIEKRLSQPFTGFDSIDTRLERVPNDLNDKQIRMTYVQNHIEWFLKNHQESVDFFIKSVRDKYQDKLDSEEWEFLNQFSNPSHSKQVSLF